MHGFFAKRTPASRPLPAAPQRSVPSRSEVVPTAAPTVAEAPRAHSRMSDRFGSALREALRDERYEVLDNVRLRDFRALTYSAQTPGGQLTREAVKRVDFLVVSRRSHLPVLGLTLADTTYGRDRRRRVEPATGEQTSRSIITLLEVQPEGLLDPQVLRETLLPHLQ